MAMGARVRDFRNQFVWTPGIPKQGVEKDLLGARRQPATATNGQSSWVYKAGGEVDDTNACHGESRIATLLRVVDIVEFFSLDNSCQGLSNPAKTRCGSPRYATSDLLIVIRYTIVAIPYKEAVLFHGHGMGSR